MTWRDQPASFAQMGGAVQRQWGEGLIDRSSRPHHLRAVTPEPLVRRIIALACHACAILTREQVRRYEREAPGDLIHLDIKKLGRFERPSYRVTGERAPVQPPAAERLAAMAGNMCMSALTIIRASPLAISI